MLAHLQHVLRDTTDSPAGIGILYLPSSTAWCTVEGFVRGVTPGLEVELYERRFAGVVDVYGERSRVGPLVFLKLINIIEHYWLLFIEQLRREEQCEGRGSPLPALGTEEHSFLTQRLLYSHKFELL